MSCWSILGISPTKNIEKIKNAYLNSLNITELNTNDNTNDDIKKAYNKAVSLATTSINDLDTSLLKSSNFEVLSAIINSSLDAKDINTVEKFISKVKEIYANPSLRLNKECWIDLLTLPILINKDLSINLESNFINFIATHKYIPYNIYLLLDSHFNWTNRKEELYFKYSKCEIDILLNELKNPLPLTYNYLSKLTSDKFEEYLYIREKAYFELQNLHSSNDKKYLSKAYSIYSKDLDLLKLLSYYYLSKNDNIMALNYFKEALAIDNNDMYCLSNLGHLLTISGQYTKAIVYLEKYNKMLRNNIDIDSLIDLANCYYHSYDLQSSYDLFSLISKLKPNDVLIKNILESIKIGKENNENSLIISIYKKYINPNLTPFINKLNTIYNDFSLRISEVAWDDLLSLPIVSNNTLFYYLESYIIDFMTTHKNIPSNIFVIVGNYFDWNARKNELSLLYPNLDIKLLFAKISLKEALNYNHLTNITCANLEKYIEYRALAYKLVIINSPDTEDYLNKAFSLFDGDYELFKLYGEYYSNNKLYKKAIEKFKTALSLKPDEYYSCCSLALLLTKIENYKEALYYLEQSANTAVGNILLRDIDFLTKYSICYYYTNDLVNAKKYFIKLSKLNNNLHFIKIYLKNINDRLDGKKRKIIPIDALTNPDYKDKNLILTTKNKLSSIKSLFSNSIFAQ